MFIIQYYIYMKYDWNNIEHITSSLINPLELLVGYSRQAT